VLLDEKIGRWFNACLTFDNKFLKILDGCIGFAQMKLPPEGFLGNFLTADVPFNQRFMACWDKKRATPGRRWLKISVLPLLKSFNKTSTY
jgi:hypothetical protein